jgi:hypothetical protein
MRKLLVFCLALVFAAAAVPALAQSRVEFSGYLNVYHENLVNFDRMNDGRLPNVHKDSDSFFMNKLHLSLKIHPTDDITVHWAMRSVNYVRWGAIGNSGGGPGTTSLYTKNLYAEVRQPWGTILIGRTADGTATNAGGLASLGYGPTWGVEFLYANPFDMSAETDGVAYLNEWDNGFGLAVYYAKDNIESPEGIDLDLSKLWPGNNTAAAGLDDFFRSYSKDQDSDRFGIEPRYSWDSGSVSLGLMYVRDMTGLSVKGTLIPNTQFPGTIEVNAPESSRAFHINPAFTQAWGPFSVHFEGDIAWGKREIRKTVIDVSAAPNFTFTDTIEVQKQKGLGLYLDFVYDYGVGNVTLMSWYADGNSWQDDENNDRTWAASRSRKTHDLVTMGDFAPFLVAFHNVTLGTGRHDNALPNGGSREDMISGNMIRDPDEGGMNGEETGNQWGIGLLGNHNINDDITLNWGLGYFRLVNATYRNQSKNLGFEIDLGARFKILDNLAFETTFGYMLNGAAYKFWFDDANGNRVLSEKPDNTFAWANVLSVTF